MWGSWGEAATVVGYRRRAGGVRPPRCLPGAVRLDLITEDAPMRIRLSAIDESERSHAVEEFNVRYGEMERALWCLSQHCRDPLLKQKARSLAGGSSLGA